MLKITPLILLLLLLAGCATRSKHEHRLQELDRLYKSGQIDAVQYQAKYAEEVQTYNAKRPRSGLLAHYY